MKFVATGYEVLPLGTYPARFLGVEQAYKEQTGARYLRWKWEATTPEGDLVTVSDLSSLNFGPKAKARAWVEGMLGRSMAIGEEIDPDDLVDTPCRLVVGVKKGDDGIERNVVQAISPAGS
jgi:hypothetical protein